MDIYTIGFTKSSAEHFFGRLINAGVKRIIDVRLNNTSQLSSFTKSKDLKYFLRALSNIDYIHEPLLAPTKEILNAFKKRNGSWEEYEKKFLNLMKQRNIDKILDVKIIEDSCLLCSEDTPHRCHRRLVAEFLMERWNMPVSIIHL